jgi:ATP-dependent Lhr-like helicase
MGTRAFRSLERCLRFGGGDLGIHGFSGLAPYYLLVHTDGTRMEILQGLQQLTRRVYSGSSLMGDQENPQAAKYDEFVPPELLRKAFVQDQLAIPEMQSIIEQWG